MSTSNVFNFSYPSEKEIVIADAGYFKLALSWDETLELFSVHLLSEYMLSDLEVMSSVKYVWPKFLDHETASAIAFVTPDFILDGLEISDIISYWQDKYDAITRKLPDIPEREFKTLAEAQALAKMNGWAIYSRIFDHNRDVYLIKFKRFQATHPLML